MLEYDAKEIEQFNGKDGKPTYVAVEGKIYDLSASQLWKNGEHMNRHHAGKDLSGDLETAPHDAEVLEKYKQVGVLKHREEKQTLPVPNWIANILQKYPFLNRHPHPMVVHFSMVYFITASMFLIWYYLANPSEFFLKSIFYMHILGIISLPFASVTGWISWKVNYLGKPIGYIIRKIVLTAIVFIFSLIVLISLIYRPDILVSPHGIEMVIPILIFSYLPIVGLIGHHGGQLVY